MLMKSPLKSTLLAENADLRARLGTAEETLRAIKDGEVDALVVESATGPQVYTLQGLDAEANRLRGDMLAQVSDAVIAVDSEDRIIYFNAAAELLYGVTASVALGRTRPMIHALRWPHLGDAAAKMTALREHGEWHGESIHITQDGRELNVESSVTVPRRVAGQAAGLLAVIRDVTERKQHEEKLRTSEIRYRRLFEAAHDGILIVDPRTRKIIDANPYMTQMLGYPHDQLVGRELFEIGLLKDEVASQEMVRQLMRDHEVRYENLPLKSRDGRQQEVEIVANLYDEDDHPVIQCNIRDITERKRSEEHVKLLMAEVNHRAKNLLAVVQAVTQLTSKYGDPATFAERLSDRIDGLAAGQDLLVKNQWQGVEISDLVMAQLAHFEDLIGTRVLIEGPRARLTTAAAQGIGMALHELATNAAKYGALSNAKGEVRIAWQITNSTSPAFSMSWLEDGGPKVVTPIRKGFGQIVIGRMAQAAVKGVAEIAFRECGVAWYLSAPVENTLALNEIGI
jgi:PAS domain S-box-containing protein